MSVCQLERQRFPAFIVALSLLLPAALVSAQSVLDAEHQLRLQQERLEEFRRQQAEKARQKIETERLSQPPEQRYQSSGDEKHCFPISAVDLQGDKGLLPQKKLSELSRGFFGFCVGVDQINQLVENLTRYYFERGYVTTRIYLPQQDLGSGTLRLEVMPGTVETVEFSSPQENRHLSLRLAVPLEEGDLLNLRAIEQGLDQLNRLPSNNARIELAPGEAPGGSRVLIDNRPAGRYRATFGYDNSGDASTGETQRNLLLEWDSPLTLNDYIYLYYQGDVKNTADALGSESASLHYSIPYRFWTYSVDLSRFEYLSTVQGFLTNFESAGISESVRASANRLVYRDQQNKLNLLLGLSRKKNRNFIQDVLLETSSRTLASSSIGATWQWYGETGSSVYAELLYHHGLKQFGALEDSDLNGGPEAQFEKTTLNMNYRSAFAALGRAWYWRSGLRGQYSDDLLYGSEQFTIGTGGSVRGYKSLGLSGDTGLVTTQEISSVFPLSAGWLAGTNLQLALGLEAGDVSLPQQSKQSLKSWYSSVNWSGQQFRISLAYAEPIAAPRNYEVPGQAVYGSFNWEF